MDILEKNNQALAEIFSDALKKTREHTDQRLNEMANSINQIVEYIKQEQPTAAASGQQGGKGSNLLEKFGIPQEVVQNAISTAFEKYVGQPETPENDRLLQLLKIGAERELKNTLIAGIKHNVRKGLLYDYEVEDVLGDKIDKVVSGGGGEHIAGRNL